MRALVAGLCLLLPLSVLAAPEDVANGFESLDGLELRDGYRGENGAMELVDDRVEGEHAVRLSFDSTDGPGTCKIRWRFPTTDMRGMRLSISAKILEWANSIQVALIDPEGNRLARHTWYAPYAKTGQWVRLQFVPGVQTTETSSEFAGVPSRVAALDLYTYTADAYRHAEIIFDALTVEETADTAAPVPEIETDVDYDAAFARTQAAMDRAWPVRWGNVEIVLDATGRRELHRALSLSGSGWWVRRPVKRGGFRMAAGTLRFMAREGLDGEWHELPEPARETVTDHAVTAAGQALQVDGLDLRIVRKLEAHELGLVVTFALINNADEPVDVALRMVTPLENMAPTGLFDGLQVHQDPEPGVGRHTDLSTFPLACVSDGEAGLAMGLAGDSLNAFMESGLDEEGAFYYGTRLHLPPGKKDVASFVVFPFRGDFGHLGAVERYYRMFPGRFWPAPDVHPGFARGIEGCGHVNSYYRDGYSRERVRRAQITHDWFYAPWKRAGDMWGREALWDYQPGFPDVAKRSPMFTSWRPEDMHADRRRKIDRTWEWNIATCWYIINSAEATLAQTIYADNMIRPLGRQGVKSYDTDYRTFAWGGLYGRVFSDDIRRACEIAQTTGFGHDNSFGHFRYRGPHVAETPGAAYDGDGPYALDGQAMALQCDYLHSFMVRDGAFRAGVKFNPGGEHDFFYGAMFSADSFMVEHRQLNAETGQDGQSIGRYWYEKLRRICGHKFIGLHSSARADNLGSEVNWREYSARDIQRVYQARLRRDMAAGLAYGIAPAPDWTMGCPPALEFQRMMVDLLARGWWPVHGVRTAAPVVCARYGERGDAAIAVVNVEVTPVQATVTLDGSWLLEEGAPIVAPYDGGTIEQSVAGTDTTLDLELRGRDWVVLEIRGAWVGGPARLRVAQGRMPARIVARVERLSGADGEIRPLPIAEHEVGQLALSEAGSTLLVYDSSIFRLEPNELESFPFVREGAPACEIVTPDEPSEFERRAAGFIAEYFRWWYAGAAPKEQRAEVAIPVVGAAEAGGGPVVHVRVHDGPQRVSIERGKLVIAAPNGPALLTLTDRVLAALDETYPWHGSFHPLSTERWYPAGYDLPGGTVEMCRELGLWGTLLRDLDYEEGLQ